MPCHRSRRDARRAPARSTRLVLTTTIRATHAWDCRVHCVANRGKVMSVVDLLIVGAGPAGMAAAIRARSLGLTTMVVDEQPAPGGQIWRDIERASADGVSGLFGAAYREGAQWVNRFRSSGTTYEPETRVWQIERGAPVTVSDVAVADGTSSHGDMWQVFMSRAQQARLVRARCVLIATGAQERPTPFPGWTLPGVMPIGAAQILLKTSRQVPEHPVWIAGSGPLPLLYMTQLLQAGGKIAGWLDTTPQGGWTRSLPHLSTAASAWRDIMKGVSWHMDLLRGRFPVLRSVRDVRALGDNRLRQIRFHTPKGGHQTVEAHALLIHEGVVPSIHMTQALGCRHHWNAAQFCLVPELDQWGESSQPGIFVAGDGAGIAGANAACVRGELAAIGVAAQLRRLTEEVAQRQAKPLHKQLRSHLSIRPLLDAVYRPRQEVFEPADETVVCRCEELSAAEIRASARIGQPGPNQVKSYTRAGMGPCQGRQCAYTVGNLIAATQCRPVSEVGFFRIRPPLKPITLAEISSIESD